MTTTANPTVDFGFFAAVPRIVRTGEQYKHLTHTHKWLYTCLKDLCGDHGTCYRALRTLSDETDISTGMLSEGIQELHKAGLIHAEKKKRASGGKEVWHITITDIWQANGKEHPSKKCSQDEQTIENVHIVNDNVQYVNKTTGECSHTEQECSFCETEGYRVKDTKSEGNKVKSSATPSPTKTPRVTQAKSTHSPAAIALTQTYDGIVLGPGKKSGHPLWDWDAAEEMCAIEPSDEDIKLVIEHLKANNKKYTLQAVWENWTLLGKLKKPAPVEKRAKIIEYEPVPVKIRQNAGNRGRFAQVAQGGAV